MYDNMKVIANIGFGIEPSALGKDHPEGILAGAHANYHFTYPPGNEWPLNKQFGLVPGSQQGSCGGRWSIAEMDELPRFCAGPQMMPLRPIQQHHCSLCAGLSAQRECLWWLRSDVSRA
jgi:hypothetical protein